jgi:hypothetical protein
VKDASPQAICAPSSLLLSMRRTLLFLTRRFSRPRSTGGCRSPFVAEADEAVRAIARSRRRRRRICCCSARTAVSASTSPSLPRAVPERPR